MAQLLINSRLLKFWHEQTEKNPLAAVPGMGAVVSLAVAVVVLRGVREGGLRLFRSVGHRGRDLTRYFGHAGSEG